MPCLLKASLGVIKMTEQTWKVQYPPNVATKIKKKSCLGLQKNISCYIVLDEAIPKRNIVKGNPFFAWKRKGYISINCPQAKKIYLISWSWFDRESWLLNTQKKNRATKNSELALETYSQHLSDTQKSTIAQSSSHSPLLPLCIGFKSWTVARDFFPHHRKAIFDLNWGPYVYNPHDCSLWNVVRIIGLLCTPHASDIEESI